MKLHIITIGQPKLHYAIDGWEEYLGRLKHYHTVRVTHIPDKHNDSEHLLAAAGTAYKIALMIDGQQFSSTALAKFLEVKSIEGREVCFLVGGPEGLPSKVIESVDRKWSFGALTLPHDLAMVVLVESLYRASTITAGHPYHK